MNRKRYLEKTAISRPPDFIWNRPIKSFTINFLEILHFTKKHEAVTSLYKVKEA